MPAQQQHWIRTAFLSGATGPVAAGYALVSNGTRYVVATAANRASHGRSEGVAITAGDDDDTAVEIQSAGVVPNSITGLGAGTATWVIVSSTGALERDATPDSGEDVIGKCNARGDLFVAPGVWDDTNTSPGGGAGDTSFSDADFDVHDDGDDTKIAKFQCSGITTGTTRTYTLPNASGTIPLLSLAQTFSALQTFTAAAAFGTDPAQFGTIRLAQDGSIWIRNEANDDDLRAFVKSNLDVLTYGSGASDTWIDSGAGKAFLALADTHRLLSGNGGTEFLNVTSSAWTIATTSITNGATSVSATGNARRKVYTNIASVQTTDATVTTLYSWTITDEAVSKTYAEVDGVRSTGAETASYVRSLRFKRDGGTVSAGTVKDLDTDEETAAWDATIDNSTSTGRVRVTGEAAKTIDWSGTITRAETTHA